MKPEQYYLLRVADGRDFLVWDGADGFSLVGEKRHADVFCSHMASEISRAAQADLGRRFRLVLAAAAGHVDTTEKVGDLVTRRAGASQGWSPPSFQTCPGGHLLN